MLAPAAAATTPLGATIVGEQRAVRPVLRQRHPRRGLDLRHPDRLHPTATLRAHQDRRAQHIWTVTVAGLGAGTLYGYRVWGPNWPYNASWTPGSNLGFVSHVDASGNRFNPNKLLTDPYAKAVTGEPLRVADGSGNSTTRPPSSAAPTPTPSSTAPGAMPKSIVVTDTYDWGTDVKPNIAMKDSIVLRGPPARLHQNDSSVTAAARGTYDGFGSKASYLKTLGVTAAELLPVHEYPQFDDPVGGATADRINYWGYMTTQFFAPNREYLVHRH